LVVKCVTSVGLVFKILYKESAKNSVKLDSRAPWLFRSDSVCDCFLVFWNYCSCLVPRNVACCALEYCHVLSTHLSYHNVRFETADALHAWPYPRRWKKRLLTYSCVTEQPTSVYWRLTTAAMQTIVSRNCDVNEIWSWSKFRIM